MARISLGCEKYGTSVMPKEDVLLYMEVALENNGQDMKEAFADMKMIDTMLHMERLYKVCGPMTRKTSSGHYRRNNTQLNALEAVIEGRVNGQF